MKSRLFLGLATAALVAGCGGEGSNSSPAGPSPQTNAGSGEPSVITAPVDYLGALGKAKQNAVKTVDLAAVNQAIRLFQTEQGRLPKDLNELVQEKYLPQIPTPPYGTKLLYDPATGEAKVVKQ
jgi:hypothetical protein